MRHSFRRHALRFGRMLFRPDSLGLISPSPVNAVRRFPAPAGFLRKRWHFDVARGCVDACDLYLILAIDTNIIVESYWAEIMKNFRIIAEKIKGFSRFRGVRFLHSYVSAVREDFLLCCLFFLPVVFSPDPYCFAITIEVTYTDEQGTGFYDEAELTEEQKALLGEAGNEAQTLGEARRNAFEYAADLLADKLGGDTSVNIEASFTDDGTYLAALTYKKLVRLEGSDLFYHTSLAEAISGEELNGQDPDARLIFSERYDFYYGFELMYLQSPYDFVEIVIHELIHALGFTSSITQDGSFSRNSVIIDGSTRQLEAVQIFDAQLYSQRHGKLLVDLSAAERLEAVTSDTGLLWDGTNGGENPCSYGQRMAELQPQHVIAADGKPRLWAPPSFQLIAHLNIETVDTMSWQTPMKRRAMDLSLGMLKDMGWEIEDDNFPPDCTPTGITVTPVTELVTTEGGGTAEFRIRLDSEPMADVAIEAISGDPGEATVDADTSVLEFTPANWREEKTVKVRGIDDDERDGLREYSVLLLEVGKEDRFYKAFTKEVLLVNADNDTPVPGLQMGGSVSAGENERTMDFVVSFLPPRTHRLATEYVVTGITAEAGSDYVAEPAVGVLVFAAEETEKTISVFLIDDELNEPDEILEVRLNRVPEGNNDVATGTIEDDDSRRPAVNPRPADDLQPMNNPRPADDLQPMNNPRPADDPQPMNNPRPADDPQPEAMRRAGGGGCAVASDGGMVYKPEGAVFGLFVIVSLLFSALFPRRHTLRAEDFLATRRHPGQGIARISALSSRYRPGGLQALFPWS